jgi:hypothetical protein
MINVSYVALGLGRARFPTWYLFPSMLAKAEIRKEPRIAAVDAGYADRLCAVPFLQSHSRLLSDVLIQRTGL